MIRILTAGESHGPVLVAIIDGLPAGVRIDFDFINEELRRRKSGTGRSKRMMIEDDRIEIVSGIKNGRTIGSPITLIIRNNDYRKDEFLPSNKKFKKITIPRPGHADLSGLLKFGFSDIKDILERASARETAIRVGAGAIFKTFLKEFDITIDSKVVSVGAAETKDKIEQLIKKAKSNGDTLGGVVEVYGNNVFAGLGSYAQFDRRLDARIGMLMFSIPSVKGVEIGQAIKGAMLPGSKFHDQIYYNPKRGIYRKTNNAGGIEGGVSNGEKIVVRLYVKPIPTLQNPLNSLDLKTKRKTKAPNPRADVCVVEAVGVIAESLLAYVLTDAICEKFGSDTLNDIKKIYRSYKKRIENV